MKKIVVLHSGGLDSTFMYHLAKQEGEAIPVYFDIGHEYAWKEKAVLPPETHIHDMTWFQAKGVGKEGNAMKNIFIPGRNMVFATLAASKYLPDEVWLGALMGEIHEGVTDKNETFRAKQNDLLDYVLSPFGKVKLVHPFVERQWGKYELTKWAVENGMQDQVLRSSSCLSGEAGNCGHCGVCLRRAGIFHQLGLSEKYNQDPWTSPDTIPMIVEMLIAEKNQDNSHYDEYRRREIVPAVVDREGSLESAIEKYTELLRTPFNNC